MRSVHARAEISVFMSQFQHLSNIDWVKSAFLKFTEFNSSRKDALSKEISA